MYQSGKQPGSAANPMLQVHGRYSSQVPLPCGGPSAPDTSSPRSPREPLAPPPHCARRAPRARPSRAALGLPQPRRASRPRRQRRGGARRPRPPGSAGTRDGGGRAGWGRLVGAARAPHGGASGRGVRPSVRPSVRDERPRAEPQAAGRPLQQRGPEVSGPLRAARRTAGADPAGLHRTESSCCGRRRDSGSALRGPRRLRRPLCA